MITTIAVVGNVAMAMWNVMAGDYARAAFSMSVAIFCVMVDIYIEVKK